jgi:hypothetical protein
MRLRPLLADGLRQPQKGGSLLGGHPGPFSMRRPAPFTHSPHALQRGPRSAAPASRGGSRWLPIEHVGTSRHGLVPHRLPPSRLAPVSRDGRRGAREQRLSAEDCAPPCSTVSAPSPSPPPACTDRRTGGLRGFELSPSQRPGCGGCALHLAGRRHHQRSIRPAGVNAYLSPRDGRG